MNRHCGNGAVVFFGCMAFSVLAAREKARAEIVSRDGVGLLVSVLKTFRDFPVLAHACKALARLAEDNPGRQMSIVAAGGIDALEQEQGE
jgi:hypothetical protein